jgi:multidrug resistance protein, MATE family
MSAAADAPPVGLRILLLLAWPVILARLSQVVIGFADAAMVRPLGGDAFAATTTGATNAFTLIILPMGIVFIVQSFAAQLSGKGDLPSARRYAWYGLMVAALAAAIALAALPLIGPLIDRLAFSGEVKDLMSGYLEIRMIGIGAVVGIEALGNWFGGLGNTRLHMMAGIVAMVSNVALNWVLIYGNLGAPELGVAGAALASALASWLGFLFIAVVFARSKIGRVPRLGLRLSELLRMLRFGVPNGLNWFLEFAAFAVFLNYAVPELGTVTVVALNIVLQFNMISFMPAFGLASAGAILVGQAVGRGDKDRVGGILRITALTALTWMGSIGVVYLVAPGALIGLLSPHGAMGPAVFAIGPTMLAISAGWQLFDALGMTVGEALRAAGDTAWCMWARVVVAWLLFVPASIIAVHVLGLGHIAIMLCLVGYLAVLALALVLRFRTGRWRDIDLTGTEPVLV